VTADNAPAITGENAGKMVPFSYTF